MPWSPAAAMTRCPRQGPQPRVSRVSQLSMWVWQEGCRPAPTTHTLESGGCTWCGKGSLLWEKGVPHHPFPTCSTNEGWVGLALCKGNVLISTFLSSPIKALQIPGSALERLRALLCVEALQEGAENTRRFFCLANPKTNLSAPALLWGWWRMLS